MLVLKLVILDTNEKVLFISFSFLVTKMAVPRRASKVITKEARMQSDDWDQRFPRAIAERIKHTRFDCTSWSPMMPLKRNWMSLQMLNTRIIAERELPSTILTRLR